MPKIAEAGKQNGTAVYNTDRTRMPVDIRTAKNDNVRTPKELYDELDAEFRFDHDPCPYSTKDWDGVSVSDSCGGTMMTSVDNGLHTSWGQSSFVNPPFSKIKPWVQKALAECRKGKTVVMLITARTNANYWHQYIFPFAKEIRFMRGKVNFPGYLEGKGLIHCSIRLSSTPGCTPLSTHQ